MILTVKKFMDFENPTERVYGTHRAVQGFAVHGDHGFVLYHTGICAVYDLKKRQYEPLAVCKLASYNDGEADKRYANHANDCMFGGYLGGDPEKPLLYVTAGNSGECDERGFVAYCAVESVTCTTDADGKTMLSTSPVQSIYYRNDGIENTPWQTPGWGWPASLVDVENGWYYLLSARYRTTVKELDKYGQNAYIITKFKLPEIKTVGEAVTLTPADIVSQFETPFDVLFTQGGTLRGGKIYYTFGCGKSKHNYPNEMRVFDLAAKKIVGHVDFSQSIFAKDEIECCAFYGDKLLINTHDAVLYEVDPKELLDE